MRERERKSGLREELVEKPESTTMTRHGRTHAFAHTLFANTHARSHVQYIHSFISRASVRVCV